MMRTLVLQLIRRYSCHCYLKVLVCLSGIVALLVSTKNWLRVVVVHPFITIKSRIVSLVIYLLLLNGVLLQSTRCLLLLFTPRIKPNIY
ncbi:hypothetical protein COOFOMLJ_02400 [Aeromonas veronii]